MKTFKLCEVHDILRDTDFYETLVENYPDDNDIPIDERFWLDIEFIDDMTDDNAPRSEQKLDAFISDLITSTE